MGTNAKRSPTRRSTTSIWKSDKTTLLILVIVVVGTLLRGWATHDLAAFDSLLTVLAQIVARRL